MATTAASLALRAGYGTAVQTFRRYYQNPTMVQGGALFANWSSAALQYWAYYDNSAYEDMARWSAYKGSYKLYRQIRSLYNPTRRLVDFYATSVYPGTLTVDAAPLPDGVPIAVPLAPDTPVPLREAVGQVWQWSNWQTGKGLLVRYGAVTGSVLLEVLDLDAPGRVALGIIWPGLVAGLDLDTAGNVEAYVLQYLARDDAGFQYLYRKEVDSQWIRTYKDDQPFSYDGVPAAYANPYGFVPAVWVKHRDLGTSFGAPAIHGSVGKVDELNSLASHVHDQVHKVIGAPALLAGDGGIQQVLGKQAATGKRPAEADWADPIGSDREGLFILSAPKGTTVEPLIGDLNLQEAAQIMTMLQTEIEQDHPELAMYRELRAMSQITGPAASRLMGDVGGLVAESAANYDRATQQALAMAMAIGGWRANNGDWGAPLSAQQQKFMPFDLDMLADLLVDIAPRPIVPQTDLERLQTQQLRQALAPELQPGAAPIPVQETINVRLGGTR